MKIVICGLWHVHAKDYYREAVKHAEILGVWDSDPKKQQDFCETYGTHGFNSFEELLQSGADAAMVCTATDMHTDVMVRLAESGIDIFTEKVLALTSAECEKIEKAVEKNGVRFMISFPHKFLAGVRLVKQIIENGELGKVNYCRYRNAHNGSSADWLPAHFYNKRECGGGAMIDLGAHGMYVIEWLLGMPQSASSTFTIACDNPKNADRVEDNAVTVFKYHNGAVAINETGFATPKNPITLDVCGESGWVRFDGNTVEKYTDGVFTKQEIPTENNLPLPITQFCTGNILDGCGMEEAKKLTKLMEMAYGR